MKRYLSGAACLLVLASTAACTAGSPTSEPTVPAGPVPAGLERFYSQRLDWGDCAPYATSETAEFVFAGEGLECARLTVPLDYSEPGSTTITLGVLRHRATETDERIGSLVLNPGGPGASGMTAAGNFSATMPQSPLTERFDLVGFDPRGIGASEPTVECLTAPERDADRADDTEVAGTVAEQEAEESAFADKCADRTEYGERMLANLGTRDVVRDLDVLRSTLGDEKLTYLGYSYGTRIGYTYAERFPGNVRALLLDGALDPEQDLVDSLVAQGEGFATAFDEFARWCAGQQDCALGTDPAAADTAYQDIVRPLIDNPIRSAGGRPLSYEDATTGTIAALYSQQQWPSLNTGLTEVKQGRGTTLLSLADMYNEREANGEYTTTQDAFVAIRCVDDPRVTDKAEILQAQRRYVEVAPFLDPGVPPSPARDACAFWPVPNSSEPHLPDVEGVPPALVISTTNDPATPYQAGVNLAKAMNGRLLTFEGTQHTVFLQGNACVDQAGIDYLVDGTLPREGTRCT
ncbi:putative hydrolase or acyltransferase of alpha/beta superfamily [Saccharomonospora marina XMU15]|uniref:Putative hydrolase or acyltransferase of alpha/beta superfamily n=1 Tax=Saccharomonospora marina XMU15 TaxID=882083 RepID=H5XBA2_9PSEU|nr:putative hydrolase or acyltransferase of alpha/beta superfamily [Saccharomonospora marina XMU15]